MKKNIYIIGLMLGLGASITFIANAGPSIDFPTNTNVPPRRTVDVACVKTGIETRDNALITAVDTFHTAATTALRTRKEALKVAWDITDRTARRAAIRTAWNDYSKSMKASRTTLRKARTAAWNQWTIDRKKCTPKGVSFDDFTGEGIDAQL